VKERLVAVRKINIKKKNCSSNEKKVKKKIVDVAWSRPYQIPAIGIVVA